MHTVYMKYVNEIK